MIIKKKNQINKDFREDFIKNMQTILTEDGVPYFSTDYLMERFMKDEWKKKQMREIKINDVINGTASFQ